MNWLIKTLENIQAFLSRKDIKNSLPIVLSLLLHVIFLFVHFEKKALDQKFAEKKEIQKIRLVLKDNKKKQVVNSEESKIKKIPEDTKFLGKKSQVHDRQTKAKIVKSFNEGGRGIEKALKGKKSQQASKPKKVSKAKSKMPTLSDLNAVQDLQMKKYTKPSQSAAQGHKNGNEQKEGLASNNDYLEEVPLGDFTKLNTTEFKFYGFYFRIRQQLEQHWGSLLQDKAKILYKKRRRIASDAKITSLKVTIDSKGNIVGVHLKSTSGVQELDDAAIESFNKAGPFPNPPKGMLVNGRAIIEWGFVVKG